MFKRFYDKSIELASNKRSNLYLGIVSFIESSFFPIPPDVMIIPMVISKKNDFIKIFFIATLFSVLGGILGYFYMPIIAFSFDQKTSSWTASICLIISSFVFNGIKTGSIYF